MCLNKSLKAREIIEIPKKRLNFMFRRRTDRISSGPQHKQRCRRLKPCCRVSAERKKSVKYVDIYWTLDNKKVSIKGWKNSIRVRNFPRGRLSRFRFDFVTTIWSWCIFEKSSFRKQPLIDTFGGRGRRGVKQAVLRKNQHESLDFLTPWNISAFPNITIQTKRTKLMIGSVKLPKSGKLVLKTFIEAEQIVIEK